jgi:hypothetical protein
LTTAFCLLACFVAPGFMANPGVTIDPSSTRVKIAKVNLFVTEVELTAHGLEANYRITVPMVPSKNDAGTLKLDSPMTIEELRQSGGNLTGLANSESGVIRAVLAEVEADGRLRIDIELERRTLSFETRFHTDG